MQFSMLSLQDSEISNTSLSIATALRNYHGSQIHQCVLRDVFTPSETWQSPGSREVRGGFGSSLWNTEYKPQTQFPCQPGVGAAGPEHRYSHQLPQDKGEAAEGRNGLSALADPLQFVHQGFPTPQSEFTWRQWWLCTRHCSKGSSCRSGI